MAGIRNTKNITIAYDTNNIKSVYLLNDGKYIKFSISEDYSHLSTMNSDEYELFKKRLKEVKKNSRVEQTKSRVDLIKNINEIVSNTTFEEKGRPDGKTINDNRKSERNKLS